MEGDDKLAGLLVLMRGMALGGVCPVTEVPPPRRDVALGSVAILVIAGRLRAQKEASRDH